MDIPMKTTASMHATARFGLWSGPVCMVGVTVAARMLLAVEPSRRTTIVVASLALMLVSHWFSFRAMLRVVEAPEMGEARTRSSAVLMGYWAMIPIVLFVGLMIARRGTRE
jgi:uncharacterized membrane protein